MANTTVPRQTSDSSRPVLLWVFRRAFDAITCQVDVTSSGTCHVRTVPHWDPSLSLVEPFENAGDALHRHAEVASRLREIGWHVADRVPMQPLAA